MDELSEKVQNLSVVQNLFNQQLGARCNKTQLSYTTAFNALKNLKPTIALNKAPSEFNKQISQIQFNAKGNLIASVYWGHDLVQIWNWSKSQIKTVFNSSHSFTVRQVNWVPADNENLIVTSGQYGSLGLTDIKTKTNRSLLNSAIDREHYGFCVDNNLPFMVLAASQCGKIVSIDIREDHPKELMTIKQDNADIYEIHGMDINPSKPTEFCIGGLKDLRIYDTRNLTSPIQKLFPRKKLFEKYSNMRHMLSVKYNYSGSEVLAAYSEEPFYLFKTSMCSPFKTYNIGPQEHECAIVMYDVHFVGTRSEFIVASSSLTGRINNVEHPHTLYMWDKDSEGLVHKIVVKERSWRFGVHPQAPVLAMNMDHSGIRIWQ